MSASTLNGGMSSMTGTLNMRVMPQLASTTGAGVRSRMSSASVTAAPQPVSNAVPLSARKSEPLDLATVERRGQPSAAPEPQPRTDRLHDIEEAPTFRPTEEDFRNPMEYIRSIAEEGRKYGIIKIIPPEGWTPDFAIDTERFHFSTRKQELNMAEGRTRANLTYLDALSKFHKQRNGANLNRFPSVDKRPLDLYKLKKLVLEKGGFELVCKQKRWAEIGRDLGYSGKIMSSLSTSLKNSYQKWLQPYEDWLRFNKPNVLQQQEIENGGPYTPSPTTTPVKQPARATPSASNTNSSAMKASMALNASLQQPPTSEPQTAPSPPAQAVFSSGFTPVNPGGFTAVNGPATSGFSAINRPVYNPAPIPSHEAQLNTPTRSIDSPLTSLDNTPEVNHTILSFGMPDSRGPGSSPLKRQLSHEDEGEATTDEAEHSERRSKRLRKDAPPTVTGSHMHQPRFTNPNRLYAPRDRSSETPGEKCDTCSKPDDRANMLFCEDCKAAHHRYCLDPPLKAKPEDDWYCPRCLVCCSDFAFDNGGVYSLKEFQEVGRAFKEKHFADKLGVDIKPGSKRQPTEDEVEREFWRLTESLDTLEPVEYGADVSTTTHGSGFPTLEKEPYNPYSRDPWNLNVLPLDKESLFRNIKKDINGMTSPWLYVGMCFSTFCWHSEDHHTYSANYQHFGATKTWYGIPGEDADKFEAAMREAVPDLFEQQPDLLFHLTTLLQPEKIKKAGVRVYAVDQRAGQFVITFPRAYHAGFNHGFNFNEAVNFAPADWEPFGAQSVQILQDFRRQPVFSHDELLLSAAQRDHTIKAAMWLGSALERNCDRELAVRDAFTLEYRKAVKQLTRSDTDSSGASNDTIHFPYEKDPNEKGAEEEEVCAYCKAFTFLSRFVCKKTRTFLCLSHAGNFECCESRPEDRFALATADHVIQLRLSHSELQRVVQKVVDTRDLPRVWESKMDTLINSSANTPLKNAKTLLAEGEKIDSQFHLPKLAALKRFVESCNRWVEDATNYITRKQQNRRKNERVWRKSSTKAADVEEKERDSRSIEHLEKLLRTASLLGFECSELDALREKAEEIKIFRRRAGSALAAASTSVQELDELIEEGKSFGLDMPEIESLEKKAKTVKWYEDAQEYQTRTLDNRCPSLQEIRDLITSGHTLGVPEMDSQMAYLMDLKQQGEFWEEKAKELMAVDEVNFQQLDDLSKQATRLPVSKETLAAIDAILVKQREAQDKIMSIYERSRDPDFRKRPMYQEVLSALSALEELNVKPPGTVDLEREQKKHEDWMRRGKKLFGKTNAPLHILHQHMKYVEEKNDACLDLNDKPIMHVEPSSRANSPEGDEETDNNGSGSVRDVFCICRKPEAGMMIECEMCHEWYHGKCLKIARGKVKEDDKYTCPICDYRVKIPRDATRPKVEELEGWQDEIPYLPFQPEEEETLISIIDTANAFRQEVAGLLNPLATEQELPTQRFYLRKIEGCEVLLAPETNFFRKQVHKYAPVAPNSPPLLEASLSTRKPRPTKLQKQMKEMGVTDPNDLPEHMRPKVPGTKKKVAEKDAALKRAPFGPGPTFPRAEGSDSQSAAGTPLTSSSHGANNVSGIRPKGSSFMNRDIGYRDNNPQGFSYDAMPTLTSSSYAPHSPLFAPANSLPSFTRGGSPSAHGPSMDPSLENMFSAPSGLNANGRAALDHANKDDITQRNSLHDHHDTASPDRHRHHHHHSNSFDLFAMTNENHAADHHMPDASAMEEADNSQFKVHNADAETEIGFAFNSIQPTFDADGAVEDPDL